MKNLNIIAGIFALVIALSAATAALVMVLSGVLLKKLKWSWLSDYALPLSLVLGMASAIPITAWLS